MGPPERDVANHLTGRRGGAEDLAGNRRRCFATAIQR